MVPAVLPVLPDVPPPSNPPRIPAIAEPAEVEVAEVAVVGVVVFVFVVAEVLVAEVAAVEVLVEDLVELVFLLVVFFVAFFVVFFVAFFVVFLTGVLINSEREHSLSSFAILPVVQASTKAVNRITFFIPLLFYIYLYSYGILHFLLSIYAWNYPWKKTISFRRRIHFRLQSSQKKMKFQKDFPIFS